MEADGVLEFIVKYEKNSFNAKVRRKQFNEIDFLCFLGGSLGLFAGFSMISFVECFYWTFIRRCRKMTAVVHPLEIQIEKNENFIDEFFKSSSIHGFGYFVDSNFCDK